MAAAPDIVRLAAGRASAEIAPSAGGRLMRWDVGGSPVLHWPDEPDWSQPAKIRGGNPLLFPFIARTYLDGVIGRWRGPDGKERPAPMHGLVRGAAFRVTAREDARLRMEIVSTPEMHEAFPFPFVFGVECALDGDTLRISYTVANTGREPMPYSVGNHFYFAVPADERGRWSLVCPSRRVARQDAAGKIVAAAPPSPGNPLDDPALIDLFHIGVPRSGVVLRDEALGRSVDFEFPADAAGHNPWYAVTTWTGASDSPFYCVEPWTALPDAVHNHRGLRWLKPGARETLRLRLTARDWPEPPAGTSRRATSR
jgi:galactose mutarotase-like enzyme